MYSRFSVNIPHSVCSSRYFGPDCSFGILRIYFSNDTGSLCEAKEKVTIPELLYATFSRLRHLRPSLILFFLFYFMLVLPLSGFASGIDIISAIQVPNFILEFIATNNWWLLTAYILLTLLSMFIGYRLILFCRS